MPNNISRVYVFVKVTAMPEVPHDENRAVIGIYRYGKFHETPIVVFNETARRYKSFSRLTRSHRLSRSDYDTREETPIAT